MCTCVEQNPCRSEPGTGLLARILPINDKLIDLPRILLHHELVDSNRHLLTCLSKLSGNVRRHVSVSDEIDSVRGYFSKPTDYIARYGTPLPFTSCNRWLDVAQSHDQGPGATPLPGLIGHLAHRPAQRRPWRSLGSRDMEGGLTSAARAHPHRTTRLQTPLLAAPASSADCLSAWSPPGRIVPPSPAF